MENRWSDKDAKAWISKCDGEGVSKELALRIYTARLLGQDQDLVLHGGGNVSLKSFSPDIFGRDQEVMFIKGSGRDLATIEASGLPAVWLTPLRQLQALDFIEDLSIPDQWLELPFSIPFFGSYFNLLPLLMTIITLVSAISYRDQYLTGDLLKGQQLKLYIMAALFFILFFTFPSGMVLYWTCSNLIQLLKSLVIKKSSLA